MNWLRLLPAIVVIALVAVFAWLLVGPERVSDDPMVGQPVPSITLEALDGRTGFDPAAIEGPYLLNIWGSWCPPCRAEHPMLHRLSEEGIRLFGINFKDTEAQANRYLDDDGDPFAGIAFDPGGRTAIEWGVTGPPETFIIAGDGTVLYKFIGPLVGDDYEQRFRPELDKALGASR